MSTESKTQDMEEYYAMAPVEALLAAEKGNCRVVLFGEKHSETSNDGTFLAEALCSAAAQRADVEYLGLLEGGVMNMCTGQLVGGHTTQVQGGTKETEESSPGEHRSHSDSMEVLHALWNRQQVQVKAAKSAIDYSFGQDFKAYSLEPNVRTLAVDARYQHAAGNVAAVDTLMRMVMRSAAGISEEALPRFLKEQEEQLLAMLAGWRRAVQDIALLQALQGLEHPEAWWTLALDMRALVAIHVAMKRAVAPTKNKGTGTNKVLLSGSLGSKHCLNMTYLLEILGFQILQANEVSAKAATRAHGMPGSLADPADLAEGVAAEGKGSEKLWRLPQSALEPGTPWVRVAAFSKAMPPATDLDIVWLEPPAPLFAANHAIHGHAFFTKRWQLPGSARGLVLMHADTPASLVPFLNQPMIFCRYGSLLADPAVKTIALLNQPVARLLPDARLASCFDAAELGVTEAMFPRCLGYSAHMELLATLERQYARLKNKPPYLRAAMQHLGTLTWVPEEPLLLVLLLACVKLEQVAAPEATPDVVFLVAPSVYMTSNMEDVMKDLMIRYFSGKPQRWSRVDEEDHIVEMEDVKE